MSHEDPGNITYADVGGLAEQIRELREVVIIDRKNMYKYLSLLLSLG